MKLATRLKVLAATIALAAMAPANAAVVTNNASTGNSDFLFSAFTEAGDSYVLGLSLRLDDITLDPTTTRTLSVPGLSEFFTNISGAMWNVVSADFVGTQFKNYRVITSYEPDNADGPTVTTDAGVKSSAAAFQNFVAQAGGTVGTPLTTHTLSDPAYAGGQNWGGNWGSSSGDSNTANLVDGAQLAAWLMDTGANATIIGKPLLTQFNKWTLDLAHDQLVYTAPAAVPVPAAVWLLGSGLASLSGMQQRRRKA